MGKEPKTLVVASMVRHICKENKVEVARGTIKAIEEVLKQVINVGIKKTKANSRSTLMPRDVWR